MRDFSSRSKEKSDKNSEFLKRKSKKEPEGNALPDEEVSGDHPSEESSYDEVVDDSDSWSTYDEVDDGVFEIDEDVVNSETCEDDCRDLEKDQENEDCTVGDHACAASQLVEKSPGSASQGPDVEVRHNTEVPIQGVCNFEVSIKKVSTSEVSIRDSLMSGLSIQRVCNSEDSIQGFHIGKILS